MGKVTHLTLDDEARRLAGMRAAEHGLSLYLHRTSRTPGTQGTGSTLNISGEITQNLYDHVLVENVANATEMVGDAEVLDVRDRAATPAEFYRTVSDHLPIVVQLRSSTADDD